MTLAPRFVIPGVLCVLVAGGCAREVLSGPPRVREGRDECAACGMIINETRFCGAHLIERDAERAYLLYDDLGCMLNHERKHATEWVLHESWVCDCRGAPWVESHQAAYLFVDPAKVSTPMGSGILAFSDLPAARARQAEVGGEIHDLAGAREARRRWMEARYGKPAEPR